MALPQAKLDATEARLAALDVPAGGPGRGARARMRWRGCGPWACRGGVTNTGGLPIPPI